MSIGSRCLTVRLPVLTAKAAGFYLQADLKHKDIAYILAKAFTTRFRSLEKNASVSNIFNNLKLNLATFGACFTLAPMASASSASPVNPALILAFSNKVK